MITWRNHVIMSRPHKVKHIPNKKVVITPTTQAHVQKFLDECQCLGKIQRSRQLQSGVKKEDSKRCRKPTGGKSPPLKKTIISEISQTKEPLSASNTFQMPEDTMQSSQISDMEMRLERSLTTNLTTNMTTTGKEMESRLHASLITSLTTSISNNLQSIIDKSLNNALEKMTSKMAELITSDPTIKK